MYVVCTTGKRRKIMKEQRKNERFLFTRVTMSSFNIYKNHWYAWRKHIKLRGHGKFLRGVCVDDKVMYLTSYVRQCRESGRSPIVCKAVLAAIAFFWKARGVDASVFLDERMKLLRRALAEAPEQEFFVFRPGVERDPRHGAGRRPALQHGVEGQVLERGHAASCSLARALSSTVMSSAGATKESRASRHRVRPSASASRPNPSLP